MAFSLNVRHMAVVVVIYTPGFWILVSAKSDCLCEAQTKLFDCVTQWLDLESNLRVSSSEDAHLHPDPSISLCTAHDGRFYYCWEHRPL